MSYPRETRVPYGMASVPTAGGVPGMTAVPAGMARVPNGMGSIYQSENPSSLYPSGAPAYQSLAQAGYLTSANTASPGQPGLYQASQHPGYLSATSPTSQQRYMVSPGYPGASYSLAGAGYTLSAQPGSSLAQPMPVPATTLSAQSQSQYPTYIGSQLGPMQISPSQNPYAAAATGYPLYPSSAYAGLQVQQAQVQAGQVPTQIPGRAAYGTTAGLPLGYPAHATNPSGASFYQPY